MVDRAGARGSRADGDFGISEVGHVDGDDYTWDWHADLRAAGSLGGEVLGGDFGISEVGQGPSGGSARPGVVGTLCDGVPVGVRYDVRTGPERTAWQVSTALYALERQLALMQQRLTAVEAELERCRGEL